MNRDAVIKAKRIVIKIGSSTLTGADGAGLDSAAVTKLAAAVAELKEQGREVVVVSSGAIAAGLAPLGLGKRPADLATQQAAASVGQGLLIHSYTEALRKHKIIASQVLLTIEDIVRRSHYQNHSAPSLNYLPSALFQSLMRMIQLEHKRLDLVITIESLL